MSSSSTDFAPNPLTNVFDSIFVDAPLSPLELPPVFSAGMGDRLSRQAVQELADRIRNNSRTLEDFDDWLLKNKARQTAGRDFFGSTAIAGLQGKPTGKTSGGSTDGGSTDAGSTIAPDLVVSRLTLNQTTLEAGGSLSVSVAIANQGSSNAGSSQTGFYLSRDQVLDGTDTLLGTANLGSLRKDRSANQSFSTTLDQALEGGTYYLIAQADRLSQITETNETNNLGVQSFQVNVPVRADLVSQGVQVSNLTDSDANVNVSYQIANGGTGPANASIANVYLSNDGVWDAQDQLLASMAIGAIAAGGISQQSLNQSLDQPLAAGTYYLFVQADGTNQIQESNEANNFSVASFTVTTPEPPPVEDNWFTQNLQDSGLKLLGSALGSDNV
ncbi:MAG: hypothetical protein RLZZ490_1650, partial [Cyanobacteriota bacterium]